MKQPVVCFFGGSFTEDQKKKIADVCTPWYYDDDTLHLLTVIFEEIDPAVIVTVGESSGKFKNINALTLAHRLKWIHYITSAKAIENLHELSYCFVHNSIKNHKKNDMVTIFTSSYKSGDFINRPFKSLQQQTHKNSRLA